jgi:hypothetical protein
MARTNTFSFGVVYKGTWNATTNSPALASGVGTQGHYYVVSVAGSTNLDGITDWEVGDWAIFNGTVWQKVDNTDVGILSVQGGDRIVIDNTDPLNPSVNWVSTTYVVRNVTGNIALLEEYTICTSASGVELTLPGIGAGSADGGNRHTIINRDTINTLKISATGADAFGNQDVQTLVWIGPGEAMTFISDDVNTWLYQQDRTMYDAVAPVTSVVANLNSANIEVMYVWRVGNEVCFRGEVVTDPIANNTQCIFRFTVPSYNGSTFLAVADAGVVGVGTLTAAAPAHSMSGQAINGSNIIECTYFETHGVQDTIVFTGSYRWRE